MPSYEKKNRMIFSCFFSLFNLKDYRNDLSIRTDNRIKRYCCWFRFLLCKEFITDAIIKQNKHALVHFLNQYFVVYDETCLCHMFNISATLNTFLKKLMLVYYSMFLGSKLFHYLKIWFQYIYYLSAKKNYVLKTANI